MTSIPGCKWNAPCIPEPSLAVSTTSRTAEAHDQLDAMTLAQQPQKHNAHMQRHAACMTDVSNTI